jgi:hypothetical protein
MFALVASSLRVSFATTQSLRVSFSTKQSLRVSFATKHSLLFCTYFRVGISLDVICRCAFGRAISSLDENDNNGVGGNNKGSGDNDGENKNGRKNGGIDIKCVDTTAVFTKAMQDTLQGVRDRVFTAILPGKFNQFKLLSKLKQGVQLCIASTLSIIPVLPLLAREVD